MHVLVFSVYIHNQKLPKVSLLTWSFHLFWQVVLLHGRGDTGQNLLGLASQLSQRLPGTRP